jgi:hypothetical protein
MTKIDDKHAALGGDTGLLGKPVALEAATADGDGASRRYENGVIYWHPRTGAHEVHGAILLRWQKIGLESGPAGYPVTDETATPDGVGRFNHFQFASIYWHPVTGAHDVHDLVRERWASFGWETGAFGYPVADPTPSGQSRFQGGWIGDGATAGAVRAVRCPSSSSANYTVPIHAVQAADGDGGRRAAISADEVRRWVERANRVFEVAGIEYTFDGRLHPIEDTEINSVTGDQDPAWGSVKKKLNDIAAQHKKLVVVFRHGDKASPTGGGFSWSSYDFVVMPGFSKTFVVGNQNIALLGHEIGHYLGLSHTHAVSRRTVAEARLHFASNGFDPGVFDGDAGSVGDTPPDPHISELTDRFDTDTVTLGGVAFQLARYNAMSYYHDKDLPPRTLTRRQVEVARQTLQERRQAGLTVRAQWGTNAEYQIYGATYDEYRERYDELWPDGWRLHLLQPYTVGGNVRYTAVWRPSTEDERQGYGWNHGRFRQEYDQLWGRNWRLSHLGIYIAGGQPRYAAAFRKLRPDYSSFRCGQSTTP